MEDGGGDIAGQTRQLLVALVLNTGLELFGLEGRKRRLADDAPRDTQAVCCHLPVFGRAEVVGRDGRSLAEVGALQLHRAAAAGVEVADAGGEGGKVVQRLAKGIQRQRLHVIFQIGVGQRRIAACKGP